MLLIKTDRNILFFKRSYINTQIPSVLKLPVTSNEDLLTLARKHV